MGFQLPSRLSTMVGAFKERFSALLGSRYRLLVPFFIVLLVKVVSSFFIYGLLNMGSSETYWMAVNWDTEGQNAILKSVAQQSAKWPFLFLGWDSAWYLSIMVKGYAFSDQSFAFFPGFPLLGGMVNSVLQNPAYSLILLSFVFGVLWVPMYQLVVEDYFGRSKALKSALVYAFFPYVFLFTSVAYAEGLFLLCTLGAWYFSRKRKIGLAVFLASVAAVSRAPGIVILLPMVFEMFRMHKSRQTGSLGWKMLLFGIPFLLVLSWFLYCQVTFNSWLTSGWSGMYSFRVLVLELLPQKGFQVLFEVFQVWPLSPVFVVFLVVAPFLILFLFKLDRALALYAIVSFLGVLWGGGLASIPRFMSFVFPLWLPIIAKVSSVRWSNLLTLMTCAGFVLSGLFLWVSFLNGLFVA